VKIEVEVHPDGELKIDGLRFSAVVLSYLVPAGGLWRGPIWLRRNEAMEVVEVTQVDPNMRVGDPSPDSSGGGRRGLSWGSWAP